MNFRYVARSLEKEADLASDLSMTTEWPSDRPTINQPDPKTDGLDPAALGGPAPMNAFGPVGEIVVSNPLVPTSGVTPGQPVPHVKGPDLDTTTLKDYKGKI